MPFGGTGSSQTLQDVIQVGVDQGKVFYAAAGNGDVDMNAGPTIPASLPNVGAVSAMVDTDGIPGGNGTSTLFGDDDTFASFSNFGEGIDLSAPGVNVFTTDKNGGYQTTQGTSFSLPYVGGTAALHIAAHGRDLNFNGGLDAGDVALLRQALIDSGFPQDSPDGFTGDTDGFSEPLVSAADK